MTLEKNDGRHCIEEVTHSFVLLFLLDHALTILLHLDVFKLADNHMRGYVLKLILDLLHLLLCLPWRAWRVV